MHNEKEIQIKAYSKGEIANLYGISYYTLRMWLKPFENEIGEYRGGLYTPAQVKIIFKKLTEP